MILPYGFFSRPMVEPAKVRTNPDAPSANQAQENTARVSTAAGPPYPGQRYPSTTANRVNAIDSRVATAPAAEATRPLRPGSRRPLLPWVSRPPPAYLPNFPRAETGTGVRPGASGSGAGSATPPQRGASRIPGAAGGGAPAGGGRTIDTTAYPTPSRGGGGAAPSGGGGGSADGGLTDADIVEILNALADGTAPAEYQQYLEALVAEAVKRGLPVPPKFRSMIPVGTSSSAPQVSGDGKGAGGAALLLTGAGGGFLVGGPVGAVVGVAAALLLGRK